MLFKTYYWLFCSCEVKISKYNINTFAYNRNISCCFPFITVKKVL